MHLIFFFFKRWLKNKYNLLAVSLMDFNIDIAGSVLINMIHAEVIT